MAYRPQNQPLRPNRWQYTPRQKIIIGIVFLLIWNGAGRLFFLCPEKNLCFDAITAPAIDTKTSLPLENTHPKTLRLQYGTSTVLNGYEEFFVPENETTPLLTLNNNQFLLETASFLRQHPEKNLIITGFFSKHNTYTAKLGFYENEGIARAETIRHLLVSRFRANAEQIQTEGLTADYAQNISFSLLAKNDELPTERHDFENMTFSVDNNFGKNGFLTPSPAFLVYADSLKRFLLQNPSQKLSLISHTDKTEVALIGKIRAENTQLFLTDFGIKNKISLQNQEAKMPVAPSTTEEGRAKNRRIRLVIF